MSNPSTSQKVNNLGNWRPLLNLTVLSAYFYASMEWLFFATKPSSLSLLSSLDSLKVLFVTAGIVAVISIVLLMFLSLPALLTNNLTGRSPRPIVGYIIPALLLSITALIMLDNFTYTILKWGIVSSKGFWRGLYALGFVFFLWWMFRSVKQAGWAHWRIVSYLTLTLLVVSMVGILTSRPANHPSWGRLNIPSLNSLSVRYPNIIILGSDGLSAGYLTAYGSPLHTTPFLS